MEGENRPLNHLLVIVDGSRRYARKAGITYAESYMKSVDKVHDMIKWLSVGEEIPVVSFYLVANYNFSRPASEIRQVFEAADYAAEVFSASNGFVQYRICGSLQKFPDETAQKLAALEELSSSSGNIVNLLIGYSGNRERAYAIRQCIAHDKDMTETNLLKSSSLGRLPIDVLVRTGGVVRLSDGPLVGIAQTRMYPIGKLFAEVAEEDLVQIIEGFRTNSLV